MEATFIKVLNRIGKTTKTLENPDGSKVAVLPYGARVIGLFTPDSETNFLWTHPALEDAQSARAFYEGEEWQNSGGDRTWLAPEVDIFFPNYPDTRVHSEPRQLDASDYEVSVAGDSISMSKRFSVYMARPDRDVEVQLCKTVTSAANPLRYERDMVELDRVQYAGYTLRTSLELLDTNDRAPVAVGLWNLLQMRHGGDMLIPTYSRSQPRVLFGDIADENLIVNDHLVRFRIVAPGEHKIAVRAAAVTGRVGYLYPNAGMWALVIRNFLVNPSGEYVDVPKDELDDLGYAFNGVSVDSALGDFCELEYHAPAVGCGCSGAVCCDDESQVWAFRGSKEDMLTIARRLLSPEV